tara:strand:- start:2327 stop:4234 length:1908 start_codon:yes stop_codon:yes gene_type:complete
MGYRVKTGTTASFDLLVDQYWGHPDALNFDLEPTAEESGIIYPVPPSLMSTSGMAILITSLNIAQDGRLFFNDPAPKEQIHRQASITAGKQFDHRKPQPWDKTIAVDQPFSLTGSAWLRAVKVSQPDIAQGWNKTLRADDDNDGIYHQWNAPTNKTNDTVDQPHKTGIPRNIDDIQFHDDTDLLWERPVNEIGSYHPGSSDFNLIIAPYGRLPSGLDFDLELEEGEQATAPPTRALFSGRDMQGWETNTPTDSRFRHPWDHKPRIGTELEWDYDQEPPLPDKDPADVPEIKEAYLYMNASSLKKMPEGIPLEFVDLQISLDIDSFSWAMSASILNSASMDQIKPGPSGPVEVEAKVNNKTWRFMIERYTVTSKHPKKSYKVSGSSLTQLLAAPYSAKQSAQIETPTNALQVIQGILENTGFEIDWDVSLADYTIPAGAWGYENKTPIEVIDELVKAAGGVLIPATALSKLYAAQRYREAPPWYWPAIDSSSLDFQIADSTIISLSSEWQPSVEYRSVYVSGITQGVAVDVTKNGTDGTPAAPDVYDALNLTTQQCRGRGISILGQSGAQEIVTVELPLPTSGAPGLVVPGKWGEIQDTNDSDNDWRALVLSTTVSVSRPGASRAMQTIRLERHHY